VAKKYPVIFSYNEDYIYTLAFSAIFMHRLQLHMGLFGIPEKVRIASHMFIGEMTKLFYPRAASLCTADLRTGTAWFLSAKTTKVDLGTAWSRVTSLRQPCTTISLSDFRPSLRSLGRAIPLFLSLPTTLGAHKIQPLNPILKALLVFFLGYMIWFAERFSRTHKQPI
jgi:hypothetical protein